MLSLLPFIIYFEPFKLSNLDEARLGDAHCLTDDLQSNRHCTNNLYFPLTAAVLALEYDCVAQKAHVSVSVFSN